MSGPYKIYLFDDSCHLYTSLDSGATWFESGTPPSTIGDDWTDMVMAVNDGDYDTIAAFDLTANYPGFNFNDGTPWTGAVAVSSDYKSLETAAMLNYTNGDVVNDGAQQHAVSGAITAGARVILVAPYAYAIETGTLDNYPRLSVDGGVTWSDVTGLSANHQWRNACFSQNAAKMYVLEYHSYLQRSDDGGNTWKQLTNGPNWTSTDAGENKLRLRCSRNGDIVAGIDDKGFLFISLDAGVTWPVGNTSFGAGFVSFQDETGALSASSFFGADFGMTPDGQTFVVGAVANAGSGTRSFVYVSTNSGTSWNAVTPPSFAKSLYNVNVAPDGLGIVVTYANGTAQGLADVSEDGGATWTTRTFDMSSMGASVTTNGVFVSAYIFPQQSESITPSGDPNTGVLIGATYRRVSAFATQAPSFVGWHRHDFGHERTLQSIGVSADLGGLLDNLDMVTTDGTNYFVEGLTQIFDEDDALTDAWFLDGAMVPDSAYVDTVSGVSGMRFTGLWYLQGTRATVCAFGLDLGDYVVDDNGTVFVPYGSGTAPTSFDYTSPGAGAYLFTAQFIANNLLTAAPRNGGVPYSGGYMPVVIGAPYISDGQILRPIAPEQTGTRAGPSFGDLRRSHYVKALLHNTIGIQFGTDFGATLQQASLNDDAGNAPTPTEMYSGLWRETLNDDYSFDSMLSWRIVRPYPATVVSIGASIEGTDA